MIQPTLEKARAKTEDKRPNAAKQTAAAKNTEPSAKH